MSHRSDCTHDTCPDLHAEDVRVRLGNRDVLDGVSVRATGGRVTGLLGPNGSGKTTLLHTLAGLRRPESGQVRLGHERVLDLPLRARASRIALVEQHATTTSELTVRQVVALGRLPYRRGLAAGILGRNVLGGSAGGDPDGASVTARAIDQVGLGHLAERPWGTLSGGERQRAHLARALAQQPEVLLLDEPTNHLDLGQQLRFLSLVRDLGLTTVAALHDLELAAAYCDDVVVLDAGRVRGAGPVATTLGADLLDDVFAVRGSVEAHPRLDRAHLVWDGHVTRRPEPARRENARAN